MLRSFKHPIYGIKIKSRLMLAMLKGFKHVTYITP